MKKVIFFDIDGTLYDFSGHMPASTAEALRQAHLNGHQLVICSGRAKYQVYPELLSSFDGYIGATGAYIEAGKKVLSEYFMSRKLLEKVIAVMAEAGARLAGMTKEHMVLNESCRDYLIGKFSAMVGGSQAMRLVMGDYELTDNLLQYSDIQKLLYHDSSWSVEMIASELKDFCDVTASSLEQDVQGDGEITIKGINKSYGIKLYLDYYGISVEDAIAFGDGPNDLDMLEYVGCGVAMGNSRQEVKAAADYVTKDISEGGIAYAMSHLGLI